MVSGFIEMEPNKTPVQRLQRLTNTHTHTHPHTNKNSRKKISQIRNEVRNKKRRSFPRAKDNSSSSKGIVSRPQSSSAHPKKFLWGTCFLVGWFGVALLFALLDGYFGYVVFGCFGGYFLFGDCYSVIFI